VSRFQSCQLTLRAAMCGPKSLPSLLHSHWARVTPEL
jgi:hypothetical protein